MCRGRPVDGNLFVVVVGLVAETVSGNRGATKRNPNPNFLRRFQYGPEVYEVTSDHTSEPAIRSTSTLLTV